MPMQPGAKPQIKRVKVEAILRENGVDLSREKMALVGIRGYYRDSMGAKGKNDLGIFDDGFAWIDEQTFATFNGNTDPSTQKIGRANLKCGVWRYMPGIHGSKVFGPYPAFRQAAPVTVARYQGVRDGLEMYKDDTGFFGINIHHGGAGTSSIGCSTLPLDQWPAFKELGYLLCQRHGVASFPYVLVENHGDIA